MLKNTAWNSRAWTESKNSAFDLHSYKREERHTKHQEPSKACFRWEYDKEFIFYKQRKLGLLDARNKDSNNGNTCTIAETKWTICHEKESARKLGPGISWIIATNTSWLTIFCPVQWSLPTSTWYKSCGQNCDLLPIIHFTGKKKSLTNGVGITGYSHAKEWN